MKIKINSITEIEVEQIKIVAKVFVGGKEVSGHLNKTLDTAIINQLPNELVGSMSAFAFGEDFSADELLSLSDALKSFAEEKQASEAETKVEDIKVED